MFKTTLFAGLVAYAQAGQQFRFQTQASAEETCTTAGNWWNGDACITLSGAETAPATGTQAKADVTTCAGGCAIDGLCATADQSTVCETAVTDKAAAAAAALKARKDACVDPAWWSASAQCITFSGAETAPATGTTAKTDVTECAGGCAIDGLCATAAQASICTSQQALQTTATAKAACDAIDFAVFTSADKCITYEGAETAAAEGTTAKTDVSECAGGCAIDGLCATAAQASTCTSNKVTYSAEKCNAGESVWSAGACVSFVGAETDPLDASATVADVSECAGGCAIDGKCATEAQEAKCTAAAPLWASRVCTDADNIWGADGKCYSYVGAETDPATDTEAKLDVAECAGGCAIDGLCATAAQEAACTLNKSAELVCTLDADGVWTTEGACITYTGAGVDADGTEVTDVSTCPGGCAIDGVCATAAQSDICDLNDESSSSLGLVIGIIVGLLAAVAIGILVYCFCCKEKDDDFQQQ